MNSCQLQLNTDTSGKLAVTGNCVYLSLINFLVQLYLFILSKESPKRRYIHSIKNTAILGPSFAYSAKMCRDCSVDMFTSIGERKMFYFEHIYFFETFYNFSE